MEEKGRRDIEKPPGAEQGKREAKGENKGTRGNPMRKEGE